MTQDEIENGNILVARFETEEPDVLEHDLKYHAGQVVARYNEDWDSIMPVCHKWDNIEDALTGEQWIEYARLSDSLDEAVTTYEIDQAFIQLIKCINWYNTVN